MKKLIVVLFMFVAVSANAQWVQMGNGMSQNEFILSFAAIENNIYAGTASGVYISTNSGANWTQTTLNNQGVTSMAVNGNTIYAGTNNGIYLSTNNGNTWTQTGSTIHNVLTVAINGNNVFAGTDEAGVYKTTNNGISWMQTSLNNLFVWSLAFSGNSLLAGGNGFYVSTDFGINWSQSYLNKLVTSLSIIGNKIFAGTNGDGVYLSTNNGITWAQTGLNNKCLYSLATINNCIFAGLNGSITDTAGVYLSTNNGINWMNISQGLNYNTSVRTLLIANNYVFAGTQFNSVWRRPLSELLIVQNISTEIPSAYSLGQNYPNPFNSTSNLKFEIAKLGNVKITVYDVQGREVETLVNEQLQPGTYSTQWNASAYSSGVYFYKIQARHGGSSTGEFSETKRMLLIK